MRHKRASSRKMWLTISLIWLSAKISLTKLQSFSDALDMYRNNCPPAQLYCRDQDSFFKNANLPVSKCCGFCECGPDCEERGSCCLSNYTSFEEVKESTESSRFSCVTPQLITSQEETLYVKAYDVEQVWMVTKCATNQTDFKSERVTKLCEDPEFDTSLESAIPVTDEYHHFRNRYCAYCNGVPISYLSAWNAEVFCYEMVSFTDENILNTIRKKKCNVFYKSPRTTFYEECSLPTYSISQCNETGLWPSFDHVTALGCSSFTDPFNSTYKNYFCYVCNTKEPIPLDTWKCSGHTEDIPITTPQYRFSLNVDFIHEKKNKELLGCNSTTQFADLKMMKCREIFCQRDRRLEHLRKICVPESPDNRSNCFSIFVKLTPLKNYELLEVQLLTHRYLKDLKLSLTRFLMEDADMVKEFKLYPKSKILSNYLYVDYLVVELTVDSAPDPDVMFLFVSELNGVEIALGDTEYLETVYFSKLAVYNISKELDVRSKIYVPSHDNQEVHIIEEFDLSQIDTHNDLVGRVEDNSCANKEIRPFRKLDVLPFIRIGIKELAMEIVNDLLILHEDYLEKSFTSWEYELHDNIIHTSLEDYKFIFDVMPKYQFYYEVSNSAGNTKSQFISTVCAFMSFVKNLVN